METLFALAGRFQERVRPYEIGMDEGPRVAQRIVVVRFGGEVDDDIALRGEPIDEGLVADVALDELVTAGGGGEASDEEAAWQDVADAIQHALGIEKDPADKALGAKLLAEVHKLLANRDSERQAAAGTSPALKLALRQNR